MTKCQKSVQKKRKKPGNSAELRTTSHETPLIYMFNSIKLAFPCEIKGFGSFVQFVQNDQTLTFLRKYDLRTNTMDETPSIDVPPTRPNSRNLRPLERVNIMLPPE